MDKFDPTQLSNFIGTEKYYRLYGHVVLTDGTHYLAEQAGAFWLMDAIASYLPQFTGRQDFIVAKLVKTNSSAQLTLDDGNDNILDQQHIPYTDFPMSSIQLYACWGGEFWVIMLCSEY
jgi:hypothetical protein